MDSELSYKLTGVQYASSYNAGFKVEAQLLPEALTDVPIVVPSPSVVQVRTCCLGCEGINLTQVPLLPMETLMANVRT